MKSQMKCWKVIRKNDRKSAIRRDRLQIEYPVGVTVKPKLKDSRLMVFKTRTHAERFVRIENKCDDQLVAVPCVAYEVVKAIWVGGGTYTDIKKFWQYYKKDKENVYFHSRPAVLGTYFAKRVKCLK